MDECTHCMQTFKTTGAMFLFSSASATPAQPKSAPPARPHPQRKPPPRKKPVPDEESSSEDDDDDDDDDEPQLTMAARPATEKPMGFSVSSAKTAGPLKAAAATTSAPMPPIAAPPPVNAAPAALVEDQSARFKEYCAMACKVQEQLTMELMKAETSRCRSDFDAELASATAETEARLAKEREVAVLAEVGKAKEEATSKERIVALEHAAALQLLREQHAATLIDEVTRARREEVVKAESAAAAAAAAISSRMTAEKEAAVAAAVEKASAELLAQADARMAIAIRQQIDLESKCRDEQSDSLKELEMRMGVEKEAAVQAAVKEKELTMAAMVVTTEKKAAEQSDSLKELEMRMGVEKEAAVQAAVKEKELTMAAMVVATEKKAAEQIAALETKLARTNEALQFALSRLKTQESPGASKAAGGGDLTEF